MKEYTIKPLFEEELTENNFLETKWPNLNKNNSALEYIMELYEGDYRTQKVRIDKVSLLNRFDFIHFIHNLMNSHDFLTEGGTYSHYDVPDEYVCQKTNILKPGFWSTEHATKWKQRSFRAGQLVVCEKGNAIVVDTQGYNYARYCGFFSVNRPFQMEIELHTPKLNAFIEEKERKEKEEQEAIDRAYYQAYYS